MGSINMQDIYDTLAKVDRGDITYKQAILQSGDVMTQKFISIIDALKKDLPWYID
jgi:hypothetical protein